MRLVRGRFLTPDDRLALVINESAAHKFFPGQDPVGQLMRVTPWVEGSPSEVIVGVVADAKQHGPDQPSGDAVFVPLRGVPEMKFSRTPLRLQGHRPRPAAGVPGLDRRERGPETRFVCRSPRFAPWTRWSGGGRQASLHRPVDVGVRLLALSLAAIGVYGVMSYTVEQRTREIGSGLRSALRHAPCRAWCCDGRSRRTLGCRGGDGGALLAALLLRTTLTDVLFETAAVDPVVMLGVSVLILAVAGLASWVPARRASRVDPMTALRAE
jgi:putative ABC transport system permease protein